MELINNFDNAILNFIRTYLHSQFLDNIMPFITKLGSGGLIWILVAIAFINSKQYRMDGVTLLGSLLLSCFLGSLILKPLVERIRPCDIHSSVPLLIARPMDYSFPSGHTMTSFAAANVIFHANSQMGIAAYILAALIAFSRLYLYVHYPSDVLAGMLLGLFVSTSLIWIIKLKEAEFHGYKKTYQ